MTGWTGLGTFDPAKLDAMSDEEREKFFEAKDEDIAIHWAVLDGGKVIYNDGQGAYLTTEKEYGDIELYVDYKMEPKGDSGIYLRTTPQVQIWDYTEEGGKWNIGAHLGSGGLWNNSKGAAGKDPAVFADKPFGDWNRFRIRQVGARTSVWLNGAKVVDDAIMENYFARQKPLRRKGPHTIANARRCHRMAKHVRSRN